MAEAWCSAGRVITRATGSIPIRPLTKAHDGTRARSKPRTIRYFLIVAVNSTLGKLCHSKSCDCSLYGRIKQVSEKREKFRHKYERAMREHGIANAPKREPIIGHSNALCETGRHDFVGPFVRDAKKRHHKIKDRYGFVTIGSKTVWHRGPRARTCRQCGQTQVHATTGQWINAGKKISAQLGI